MCYSSTERVLRPDNRQRSELAVALWHGQLRHNAGRLELGRPRPLHAVERSRIDGSSKWQ